MLPYRLLLDIKKFTAYTYDGEFVSTECIQMYLKKQMHIELVLKSVVGYCIVYQDNHVPFVQITNGTGFETTLKSYDILEYVQHSDYDAVIGGVQFIMV